MSDFDIPGQHVYDLAGSRGNGPFRDFLGVVLHVNVSGPTSNGTDPSFYAAGPDINPDSVCPNWQVHRDGTAYKMLPANWQPWTQAQGNGTYASIETGGDPDMPLTAAQIATCGRIIAGYHAHMGMPLTVIDRPGLRGFGTHGMGGAAWGGHPGCLPLDSTEVLTPLGWANLRDVDMHTPVASYAPDSGLLTFAVPLGIVEPYFDSTVRLAGIEMTSDHRMHVLRSDSPSLKVLTAAEIGAKRTNWQAPACGNLADQPGAGIGPDLMRLLVWVQADGHYQQKNGHLDHLHFHFAKERKVQRVKDILDTLDKDYRVSRRRDGTTVIKVYGLKWLRENVLRWLPDKRWGMWLLNISADEFSALDGDLLLADGHMRADMHIYSTSLRENADAIQALYVTRNRSAAIHGSRGQWTVQLHLRRTSHALRDRYETARASTLVGCLTTENDTILVRQGGRVMIVGNCPGSIRARQRSAILDAARGHRPEPPNLLEQIMALDRNSTDYRQFVADITEAVWTHPVPAVNSAGQKVKWPAQNFLVDAREYARRVMMRGSK